MLFIKQTQTNNENFLYYDSYLGQQVMCAALYIKDAINK